MIDSMYSQFGGTHFYDYHNAFSRKAEQYYLTMVICVDWSCRDSALYIQAFAGQPPVTCAQAYHIPLNSVLCQFPTITISLEQAVFAKFVWQWQTDMDVILSSTTERKYVTILITLTAVMPLTRTFLGFRTFAAFVRHLRTPHSNVQRADYQGQTTTSYSIQTVTKSVSRLQILLHALYQMNFRYLNLQCVYQHY